LVGGISKRILKVGKTKEKIILSKGKDSLKSNFLSLRERPSRQRLSLSKRRKMLEDPK